MRQKEEKNLENKPKRQKITIGSVLEIPIDGKYYVYAQILPHSECVFFNFKSKSPLVDYRVLNDTPILFVLGVYNYVITKGLWKKVGKLPIREELNTLPLAYMYDRFTNKFCLYNNNTGEITPSTKEAVRGLERAAVWGENHVVDRIRDYYNGVPCIWLKEHYVLFPESMPR